jgi:hypothetical protein
MKRAILAAPFVLLGLLAIGSHWTPGTAFQPAVGNLWALLSLWCLGSVPVISRVRLWLGYVAMIFPFVLLGLFIAFDWGNLSIGW